MTNNDIKVAIYCRLSRDDENTSESESIQNQKILLTKYATDKGYEIYDYYCDDGYTGLNFDRPEFQRLKKDITKKYFSIVLCKDQSRIGRDNSGVDNFLHEYLIENKVRCIGIVDNLDNFNQQNKKASQITGLTNEWYSEEISKKHVYLGINDLIQNFTIIIAQSNLIIEFEKYIE
jgi:DNA invertase Pin-like site-specific DNA recombinase